ncbi:MAG: hypothetical protein HYV09_13925 [Deltaproteobacteria bacterium]|nr:hypothetical protein [Deltaproteobacteria bacterium]
MDRPTSSEIRSRRRVVAAVALGALAVASGAMLVTSPVFAIGASPLVFGATDSAANAALGTPAPSVRVRVVARMLASAAWGGAASTIVATRGTDVARSAVRLPRLAIALAVGAVIGAFAGAGEPAREGRPPRAPLAEAPLVGVLDVLTAAWTFVLSIAAHDAGLRTRAPIAVGIALALSLRALVVARVAAYGARMAARGESAVVVSAAGFVSWLALAAVACTLAATPITWSGLGTAVVLTVAAGLAESRRRRPLVVFLRGSLAFAFAAMLGAATFLAT